MNSSSEICPDALSVRITADGLVYWFDNRIGCRKQFISAELSQLPYLWTDIIESHPDLGSHAGPADIVYPSSHFVLIPAGMSGENDADWWRLAAPVFAERDHFYCGTFSLGEGYPLVAAGWSTSLMGFLSRCFGYAAFTPSVVPFAQYVMRRAAGSTQTAIGAEICEAGMDVVVCAPGQLIRANHYSWQRYREVHPHVCQVLYFLSRNFFDARPEQGSLARIILSDGTEGAERMTQQVIDALSNQFAAAGWSTEIRS